MSHMQLQITDRQRVWVVETTEGVAIVPSDVQTVHADAFANLTYEKGDVLFADMCDLLKPYVRGTITSIEVAYGYAGRYRAPGYLDCTDWSFDSSRDRLETTLKEMYGDE